MVLLGVLLAVLLGNGNVESGWNGMSKGKKERERRLEISVK